MRVVSKFIVLHLSNPSYNLAGVQEKSRLVVAIPPPHPPHSGSELCASLHIPPPSQGRLAASRLKSEHVEVEHSARRDLSVKENPSFGEQLIRGQDWVVRVDSSVVGRGGGVLF